MKKYDWIALGFLVVSAVGAILAGIYTFPHKTLPVYTATIQQMRSETVVWDTDIGSASGVIISPTEILTARHATADAKGHKITVTFFNGEKLPAIVEWESKDADVALLSVAVPKSYQIAPVACREPIVDEDVIVIGSPEMLRWIVSHGTVLTDRPLYIPDFIPVNIAAQLRKKFVEVPISAVVAPGSSGGPVFDSHGNVIGEIESIMVEVFGDNKSKQASTINFMVPSKFFCGSELKKA